MATRPDSPPSPALGAESRALGTIPPPAATAARPAEPADPAAAAPADDGTAGRVIGNWRHLIPQQTIHALWCHPETALLWGGSSVSGGGGTTALDVDAHLFSWDTGRQEMVSDRALPGVRHVVAMAAADGLLLLTTSPQRALVAVDPVSGEERWTLQLPGQPHPQSLQAWSDGYVWGLAGDRVFRVRAATASLEVMGQAPQGIHCGMALTEAGVYFGHGAHLWRYRP